MSSFRQKFEQAFGPHYDFFDDQDGNALDYFAEPLTIYVGNYLVQPPDRRYLEKLTAEYIEQLKQNGTVETTGKIIGFHENPKGFRVVIRFRGRKSTDWVDLNTVEYFCRPKGQTFEVEMLVVTGIPASIVEHLDNVVEPITILTGVTND